MILTDSDVQQPEINTILVKAIAKSYLWNKQILTGEVENSVEIQKRENLKSNTYVKSILDLRFLAPDIVEAILKGTQPKEISLQKMFNIKTLNWAEQRTLLNV